jgi:hypothetical protein
MDATGWLDTAVCRRSIERALVQEHAAIGVIAHAVVKAREHS